MHNDEQEIENSIKTINMVVSNFTVKVKCLQNCVVPRNTV
jgi:hypothetical protein